MRFGLTDLYEVKCSVGLELFLMYLKLLLILKVSSNYKVPLSPDVPPGS